MLRTTSEAQEDIIGKIVGLIKKQLPAGKSAKSDSLIEFAKRYYANVALEDLTHRSTVDLYGAMLSHWNLMEKRSPNESKVHIFNPHQEQHGWQSTHTVVQVTHEDMPFLVDSLRMVINRLGHGVYMMIHLGGMVVKRDKENTLTELLPRGSKKEGSAAEAVLYFEISRVTEPKVLKALEEAMETVLADVQASVEDWKKMREQVQITLDDLEQVDLPLDPDEINESKDFLRWIQNDRFTFLGCRDYEIVEDEEGVCAGEQENGRNKILRAIPDTGLGVLRANSNSTVCRSFALMTPEARRLALSPQILIISKTNTRSTVHRDVYTDYIGVKRFDNEGNVIGERRFIGLYTSEAYNTNPKHIPFLRRKVGIVLAKSKLSAEGHAGKELLNIIETLPRDDLFQTTPDELLELGMGIMQLQERKRIRLFARRDIYGRFISCFVFVPRENYNTELRMNMESILRQAFNAHDVSFSAMFSSSILARIHFVLRVDKADSADWDLDDIEKQLIEVGRTWQDNLQNDLCDYFGEERGCELMAKYRHAFPASYRESFITRTAAYDIDHIEKLKNDALGMSFYRPLKDVSNTLRFKLFHRTDTIPLSDVLPILENMGLRVIGEQPYEITLNKTEKIWINDFEMVYVGNTEFTVESVKHIYQEAFEKIWLGEAENDGFNSLVLGARMSAQDVSVLRAIAKYLRQIGFNFSQTYIEETLSRNPSIARNLVDLFYLRFDPDNEENPAIAITNLAATIEKALDEVSNLDQDRILRRYLEIIHAITRTNYFQETKPGSDTYLSIKLDPLLISDMPLPRPMFEIFVYSPRFEGVHLRGAKVARGGLRWSDRREDFRTEVLGLMKAQQVKNAVIVPLGAKGGFVPKCLPIGKDREAFMAEGIRCYKSFINGLLDISDNLVNGIVVPPPRVVRYDDDDPYLVVAADKGTATFSDIANEISNEHNFWLGDAFASGGSAGYDHKKMGITARGAWESVKRHFRELGIDTQTTDFTVVGVGDMAGDVFGNGMLLSRHIRLVGAFNHMHIFIDPYPDSETSYKERERLFNLPRSSWTDYDESLISSGGGIFLRSAKSIQLTPEIKELFGLEQDFIVPNDLIKAMLKSPVDLLWNGGIGTYVKAESESHLDAGDRANDGVRLNGSELNCRVIGEGGNLGCTQLGRIEYEINGGIINTDFIDNSAGVDCSDHEVNIKILLNQIVSQGDLTEKQRNLLLADMSDEVADLVLMNNYRQTQAISLAADKSYEYTELFIRYMMEQERKGNIDRGLEFLPSNKILRERHAKDMGLTRPEISVLLAYSKNIIKQNILNSEVPEDPFLCEVLESAFPIPLRERYREEMENHSLRREIIATQLANAIINEMGITFVTRLQEETGAPVSAVVRAYTVVRTVFAKQELWEEIDALDYRVDSDVQYRMVAEYCRLLRRATRWVLRNRRTRLNIQETIDAFSSGIKSLNICVANSLYGAEKEQFDDMKLTLIEANVPESLATRIAITKVMTSALDIIHATIDYGVEIDEFTQAYFAVGEELGLSWFREQIYNHPVTNHWEALARSALRDDLDWQQCGLAVGILKHKCRRKNLEGRIESWKEQYAELVERWNFMLTELKATSSADFTMFTVAVRELLDLAQTSKSVIKTEKTKKK